MRLVEVSELSWAQAGRPRTKAMTLLWLYAEGLPRRCSSALAQHLRKRIRALLFAPPLHHASSSFPSPSARLDGFRHFTTDMASDAMEAVSTRAMPQEDLTDEQMEEMLAQATTRLREKEEAKMFETEAPQKYTCPKMNAGDLEKPYVVTKGHIAEADKARLIDEKYRQNDGLIRKVEDPVTAKKLAEEVRSHSFAHIHHVYEEDIPNFPSSRVGAPFWCSSAKLRAFLFIVTLRHFHYTTLFDLPYQSVHQLT